MCLFRNKSKSKSKIHFLDETLITVRALNRGGQKRTIQEFARIVFVDDLRDFSVDRQHARPLKKRPIYEAQDGLKIVC